MEEEVKEAIRKLLKDKALRSDGFPMLCYRKYWDLVEEDVNLTIEEMN